MELNGGTKRWNSMEAIKVSNNNLNAKKLCESSYRDPFVVLNNPVKVADLQLHNIDVHENCPPTVINYIQKRVEWTIPVLNRQLPNSPCWKYLGAKDKDGYARHNPKSNRLPVDAQNCSHLLYRFIFRWLYMPEGIPEKSSDGERLEVDHICGRGTSSCIHPMHLQLLPRNLNQELGNRNDY